MTKKLLPNHAKKPQFIEGADPYRGEYDWWLANAAGIIRGPLEVVRLDADLFYSASLEEVVAIAGHKDFEPLYYNVDVDNSDTRKNRNSFGTGYAFAARDHYGKVRPFIAIRGLADAPVEDPIADGYMDLLVLLHELGHAEDISRCVNYDHDAKKLNLVDAELYAHDFVRRHALKCGYNILFGYYLNNIEAWRQTDDDSLRLPAERFCESNSIPDLRASLKYDIPEMKRRIKKAGREREFSHLFR